VTLQHWQQDEAIQFVTFRLADSIPQTKARKWKEERAIWLTLHPKPWTPAQEKEYHQRFTKDFEDWLDEGKGACIFNHSSNRELLEETMMHDEGKSAHHHAWVIMPNHVHLLFTPVAPIDQLMKSWKGISSRKIGIGSIWQTGYRETVIRDEDQFAKAVRYIRKNPVKLREGIFTLWQSERARAIQ
jgi:REP element-mobilizing transposase RayT